MATADVAAAEGPPPVGESDARRALRVLRAVAAFAGVAAAWVAWRSGWGDRGALAVAFCGFAFPLSGHLSARRQRRVDAEVERARAEWSTLVRDAAAARRAGIGDDRWLRERGYREATVRRWIADHLGPGPGR